MKVDYYAMVSILTGKKFTKTHEEDDMVMEGYGTLYKEYIEEWKKTHDVTYEGFDIYSKESLKTIIQPYLLEKYPELLPVFNSVADKKPATPEERQALIATVDEYKDKCAPSYTLEPIPVNTKEVVK